MALPGRSFEVREYNYRIPCQNLGMGLCLIRILSDCNLAFLEPDVFSYGMRKPLNAILNRMLKKSASLSCSFGLFGLSGLFGWNENTQLDQTDQITR
jgi:hypothetical protein